MRMIDADALIKKCGEWYTEEGTEEGFIGTVKNLIDAQPTIEPGRKTGQWIPFQTRPLDEEEKEYHPEWDCILEGKLPDNGQRILVNIKYKGHEAVQMDEYYDDEGCYLESGYDIGTEANAWMPLPEPWEGDV